MCIRDSCSTTDVSKCTVFDISQSLRDRRANTSSFVAKTHNFDVENEWSDFAHVYWREQTPTESQSQFSAYYVYLNFINGTALHPYSYLNFEEETAGLIERFLVYANFDANEVIEFIDTDPDSACFGKIVGKVFSRLGRPVAKSRLLAVMTEYFGVGELGPVSYTHLTLPTICSV